MSAPPERIYEPNPKHKEPKGFGSLCPSSLSQRVAQTLLERAISLPDAASASAKALYVVDGQWCFCAFQTYPHGPDERVWHGFPVVGETLGEDVLKALQEEGHIDARQRRQLRRQKALPKDWPC